MTKASRMHHGDEFGRTGSGNATAGLDGPVLGAAGMIIGDGITERESGKTPPPPPISVKALAIGLAVVLVVGVVTIVLLLLYSPIPVHG